jgi:hypothetical protein
MAYEELPVFVDEPAEYESRGCHIVAKWKGRVFHIPVAVAQQQVARLNRALDQCFENRGKVIPLPARH